MIRHFGVKYCWTLRSTAGTNIFCTTKSRRNQCAGDSIICTVYSEHESVLGITLLRSPNYDGHKTTFHNTVMWNSTYLDIKVVWTSKHYGHRSTLDSKLFGHQSTISSKVQLALRTLKYGIHEIDFDAKKWFGRIGPQETSFIIRKNVLRSTKHNKVNVTPF